MASDEYGDKTEQPTDRKRSDAREKGNVARSVDLNAAGHMLAATAILYFLGSSLSQAMAQLMKSHLSQPLWMTLDKPKLTRELGDIAQWTGQNVLPVVAVAFVAALAINLVQVGFLFSPEGLQPKWSRLSPLEGAKRIFSMQGFVRVAVSLGKILVFAIVAIWFTASELPLFMGLDEVEVPIISVLIGRSVIQLAFLLSLALIVLAVLDYAFQRWKFEQDLMMTKQEVRDEMKNMEGDPLIRQRRREAHRKLAQARDMQRVADADVVITNPTHIAVALKYDPETMPAPMVVAKGMGTIAERIRRIAIENGVPIIERKPLARALYRDVKAGHVIPPDLYEVFVEIMAYVYRITGRSTENLK